MGIDKIIVTIDWMGTKQNVPEVIKGLDEYYQKEKEGCIGIVSNPIKEEILLVLTELLEVVSVDNYIEVAVLNSNKGYSIYIGKEIEILKERIYSNDRSSN